jgi:hypothetical protein
VLLILWLAPTILALALLLLIGARKAVNVRLARTSSPARLGPTVKLGEGNPAAEASKIHDDLPQGP